MFSSRLLRTKDEGPAPSHKRRGTHQFIHWKSFKIIIGQLNSDK